MEVRRIMCCCGSGLGSSMLVRMNVEKVLKQIGVENIDVSHSSVSDATEGAADLFVVGKDLEEFVSALPNVIILDNIMDMNELETKLREVFNK
ncbi:PTS sugar transporter subunit IIB [Breznakia pachnodae]|jgi:PTS system ascorbate-specific IIB component|uniref:PTS system ascorbate-specific IIB component n=1 Tax=Breznakia pachnodae TaxID=265178 RepID=A0ABU0DZ92_9FIRM|nr:PTS sugar transporter subunit IIB [Breznakia pachnodae]MDQ0359865.1 PTS system ascorbate-specific IIB component [Breznakia pachnodae]